MLTTKQYDYLRFKNALFNNIIYFEDLPDNILETHYFSECLIGSIYKSKFNSAPFEIIQAIKMFLNISTSIYKDKTNCFKIKTTIENVINYLKYNRVI